jgi:D-xylonolactonase
MKNKTPHVECLWKGRAILGEGPVYSKAQNGIYWVDIKGSAFHLMDLQTYGVTSYPMPEQIGWLAERKGGGLIAGFQSGFVFIDPITLEISPIGNPEESLPDNRLNDAKVDKKGRIWAGSMDNLEQSATGSLYRLDVDLTWQQVDTPYVVANGPALTPDETILYHTSSTTKEIFAFDIGSDGSLNNKRLFIKLHEGEGYPDGMTCDVLGGLWVAHWEGWCVSRYLPDGTLDFRIDMPVSRPTSLCFGGENLDELFITSASVNLTKAELLAQPLAGSVFRIKTEFKGMGQNLFGG